MGKESLRISDEGGQPLVMVSLEKGEIVVTGESKGW